MQLTRPVPLLVSLFVSLSPLRAQESAVEDGPPPDEIREIHGAMNRAFEPRVQARTRFPKMKERLEDLPPFFHDTRAHMNHRNYYFDRESVDDIRSRSWAQGGSLAYRTGWFKDFLAFGFQGFTSQRLYGEEDEDGARLLQERQKGYTVLGVAYAQLQYRDQYATFYRQTFDLPYLNRQDNRMTPNTFEGYSVGGAFWRIQYLGGYLRQMKLRNSDTFTSMPKAAGVPDLKRGTAFGGALLTITEDFTVGAINYYTDDVLNIAYAESNYYLPITEKLGLKAWAQYTDQRSVGDDRLTGSSFRTHVTSAKVGASFYSGVLWAAFSSTDSETRIRSPFGSYPGYISLMQSDFNRAGEEAWALGLSYDFKRLGLDGVSAFMTYAEGYNAKDVDPLLTDDDRRELNLTLDYFVDEGIFRGIWLRVRGSVLDRDNESSNGYNFRAILNYDVPLF